MHRPDIAYHPCCTLEVVASRLIKEMTVERNPDAESEP